MEKILCIGILIFITVLVILIFTLPTIFKRRKGLINQRLILLVILSLFCLFILWKNRETQEFLLYKQSPYAKFSIRAVIFFYSGPIILKIYKFFRSFSKQTLDDFFSYTIKHLKIAFEEDILLQLFVLPAIEEIIFRAFYCNILLNSCFSIKSTVIISSLMFGLSRIYYFFTSPAAFTNKQGPLIIRTLKFMGYSSLFGVAAGYAYCKSHSLHAPFIMNSIYNYIDNPLCLGIWNSAKKSVIQIVVRLAIVFGYIYALSIIAMFCTSDKI